MCFQEAFSLWSVAHFGPHEIGVLAMVKIGTEMQQSKRFSVYYPLLFTVESTVFVCMRFRLRTTSGCGVSFTLEFLLKTY